LSLHEVNEACQLIQEEAHEDANIIFGAVIDEKLKDEMRITVIATGFGRADAQQEPVREPEQPAQTPKVVNFPPRKEPANRDIPAFMRVDKAADVRDRISNVARGRIPKNLAAEDEYDIPTFLRKQAD
ncbi:MAG TPA: cell division protein FtsZ, partial [Thermodesulfobacteriota bacterium]|nr:cell division protein FtsZ [Thermodesulfobacteriota bacterium]